LRALSRRDSPRKRSCESRSRTLGLKAACSTVLKSCSGRWVKMLDSKELQMIKPVVVAAALLALALTVSLRAEILEQVLVKVNGDIVTKSDFERLQVELLRQRPELQNVTAHSAELQKALAESTPQLILNAVDELLLVQRGRELGYAMSDEQFK